MVSWPLDPPDETGESLLDATLHLLSSRSARSEELRITTEPSGCVVSVSQQKHLTEEN